MPRPEPLDDTVRHLMHSNDPKHRATPGHAQQDLWDIRNDADWNRYFEQRYGKHGAYADDPDVQRYRDEKAKRGKRGTRRGKQPKGATEGSVTHHRPQVVGYGSNSYGGTNYGNKSVYVVYPNGVEEAYTVPWDCDGWWRIAEAIYPPVWEQNRWVMRIPVERCEFSYGEPKFNACVYTATDGYMGARWGRKLDDSDRRWLAKHQLATDDGIPQEYTITAVQQLVAPYGMAVARVRLRAGQLVMGDENMKWLAALGCNPLAMADRRTSNAEAAEKLGMDLTVANALWRLEFHDQPLAGSIVGEKGWTNNATTGVAVGSFGGHARYLAPRAHPGNWTVSIQLAPSETVEYLVPPPDPEYVERKGPATLLVSRVVDPEGNLIAVREGTSSWKSWKTIQAQATGAVPINTEPVPVTVGNSPTTEVAPRPSAKEDIATVRRTHGGFECLLCGKDRDEKDRTFYTDRKTMTVDVCIDCSESVWHDVPCPHCKKKTEWHSIPEPDDLVNGNFEFTCQYCADTILIPTSTEDPVQEDLVDWAYACFYYVLEDEEQEAKLDGAPAQTPPTPDVPPLALIPPPATDPWDDVDLLHYGMYD